MASIYETTKKVMAEYFASQGISNYPKFDMWIDLKIEGSKKKSKPKPIDTDKHKYLDFVYLSDTEYDKLEEEYGDNNTKKLIQSLNNYIGSKGTNYKSHFYTLKAWAKKDNMRRPVEHIEDKPISTTKQISQEQAEIIKQKMLLLKKGFAIKQ